jgi:hypothetical protein
MIVQISIQWMHFKVCKAWIPRSTFVTSVVPPKLASSLDSNYSLFRHTAILCLQTNELKACIILFCHFNTNFLFPFIPPRRLLSYCDFCIQDLRFLVHSIMPFLLLLRCVVPFLFIPIPVTAHAYL